MSDRNRNHRTLFCVKPSKIKYPRNVSGQKKKKNLYKTKLHTSKSRVKLNDTLSRMLFLISLEGLGSL